MPVLLSFIIPIYNVENYLKECVDSVLKQATASCEIILVDDGSPDTCGIICDEYKKQSALVKVIHQKNKGLSGARNAGLEMATGEYVAFVDADDRISDNSVLPILDAIKNSNCDIFFMHVERVYPDGRRNLLDIDYTRDKITKSRESAIKYLTTRNKYPGAAWSKIYRKKFLDDNNIRFPNDRRISEDLGFTLKCLLNANTFDCLCFPYYEYRQGRQGSITKTISKGTIDGLQLFITESVDCLCLNNNPIGTIEKQLMSFVAYEYAILMHVFNVRGIDNIDFLVKYQWVLRYARNYRLIGIYLISKMVGIKRASNFIHIVKSILSKMD